MCPVCPTEMSRLSHRRFVQSMWNYTLGIGNGVGKQGRGNRPPYRRYGPDTEIQYRLRKPHGLAKPSRILRAACLQNETAPKSLNFKTKNGPKNAPKLPRKILSLVLLCRISHRHYSKIFHREFPHKIKYFSTTRICRHGHAKNSLQKGSRYGISVSTPHRRYAHRLRTPFCGRHFRDSHFP